MLPKTFYEDYPFKTWHQEVSLGTWFKNKIEESIYHLKKTINTLYKKLTNSLPFSRSFASTVASSSFSFGFSIALAAFLKEEIPLLRNITIFD